MLYECPHILVIEISGVVKQCSPWQLTMTTQAMSPFLLEPCNGLWPSSMSNTLLGKLEKYLLAVLRLSVRKVWREFLTKYWDLLLTSGPAKVAILRVESNNGVVVGGGGGDVVQYQSLLRTNNTFCIRSKLTTQHTSSLSYHQNQWKRKRRKPEREKEYALTARLRWIGGLHRSECWRCSSSQFGIITRFLELLATSAWKSLKPQSA